MKKIMLVAWTLVFTGCAVSKDAQNQNTAQIRQNEQIQSTYGPIVGTYTGQVKNTSHGNEQVQLVIYIATETATNPDGTTGSREVPRAFFKRTSPVVAYYATLAAGYTQDTGILSLIEDASDKDVNLSQDLESIDASVSGNHITGKVQMASGTLGDLDVTLTSTGTGSTDDYVDVLRQAYQAVQGRYEGFIVNPSPRVAKLPVIIHLSAVVDGDKPTLVGFYERPDVPGHEIDLGLTVSFRPDQYPAQLTMNGKGAGQYQIDIDATIQGNVIQGAFNTLFQGYLGNLNVTKVSNTP